MEKNCLSLWLAGIGVGFIKKDFLPSPHYEYFDSVKKEKNEKFIFRKKKIVIECEIFKFSLVCLKNVIGPIPIMTRFLRFPISAFFFANEKIEGNVVAP